MENIKIDGEKPHWDNVDFTCLDYALGSPIYAHKKTEHHSFLFDKQQEWNDSKSVVSISRIAILGCFPAGTQSDPM